jgi:HD-GYP domain-containing protein (c-di-GMP phosphodiesterase class II)
MAAAPGAESWHPDDMLLLPLRRASGEIIGVVSVDEPLSGRRPDDAELNVLMAVADHAGLALEQAQRVSVETREQSQELLLAAVMLLAEAVDLRDPGTAQHSRTVGIYARETALALGLDGDRVERIHAAGVLHDLGKLGIADAIIYKAEALDAGEWREIQRHPEIGARILEHAGMHDIAGWVRAHHERLDAAGYPARLPAQEIPLEARILAVADAYEAMTADRPYRRALPVAQARAELLRCAGTQFDPAVVEAFLGTRLGRKPARVLSGV